ncbi:MAG TPA: N-6 DNA methylase [Gallionella sp.]|nr:N-6 DNA methylase [Gallionella sp.]
MQVQNTSITSDTLGRYYTSSYVGTILVNSMGGPPPESVLDLGAGDGALTAAAAKKWLDATYYTVDIDKNAKSSALPQMFGSSFRHHVGDALASTVEKRLGLKLGSTDLAICNPPYIRPRWRKGFANILEDAGLSHVLPKLADVPAEILFIAQNLRFLRSDGRLGLIVPDGVIAGEKFAELRNVLATEHCIERVIELPRGIFKKTEAKAHILVMHKSTKGPDEIQVQRLDETGTLSPELQVQRERAARRLDYTFLVSGLGNRKARQIRIGDVTTSLVRGSISSSQRVDCNFPVLHTTDLSPSISFVGRAFGLPETIVKHSRLNLAKRGDILIGRVGRNFEEKICMVKSGTIAVSDCILILTVAPEYREPVFTYLKSDLGRKALSCSGHGVGARFLTSDALQNILFTAK